jgi:hypothetical protein
MYDDDPQVVSLFLPCTTSIRLDHDVFNGMAEHPIEPLGEHTAPYLAILLAIPMYWPSSQGKKLGIAHGDVSALVELHRCHRVTANACVPTIESSLTPAGAAADDPRARPA